MSATGLTRIVSGMRPTGRLHLGHYLGVIKNWLKLQDTNECFFFVADFHALSTTFEDGVNLRDNSYELVKTWLACGIDPQKSVIYIQSDTPEVAELYLLLNMITPLGWLERNPTYKDQIEQLGQSGKDVHTGGFLTYPVLQAADIIMYDAHSVPIGEDQKPHLEIAREIVRRFHHLFSCEIFKEPKEMLSETPKLTGLDGRKMSKSYNNAIYLNDTEDEIWQKLRVAKTDTNRVKKTDCGDPNLCLVYDYHKEFSDGATCEKIANDCRCATIGCVECKKICFEGIKSVVNPIREKYEKIDETAIKSALERGQKISQTIAKEKLSLIKQKVFEVSKS